MTRVARGRWKFLLNVLAFRAMRLSRRLGSDVEQHMSTKSGISFAYRRNRGDIQGIREVLINGVYRLPDGSRPTSLVDLGANIGLTSLWLCAKYPIAKVVAVEPLPANAAMLRSNLTANGVQFEVLEAAIGPASGEVSFAAQDDSNAGFVGDGNLVVPMVSMDQVLERIGGHVDLLKMDIEGGEQALIVEGKVDWLDAIDVLIAELHPAVANIDQVVEVIVGKGFTYHAHGTLWPESMDIFVRR
jgi:FkbM family methyltransferase